MGSFSVADAYLYTVSRWGRFVGVDTSRPVQTASLRAAHEARPGVQGCSQAGLIK